MRRPLPPGRARRAAPAGGAHPAGHTLPTARPRARGGRQGAGGPPRGEVLWLLGPHAVSAQLQAAPEQVLRVWVAGQEGGRPAQLAAQAATLGLAVEQVGAQQLAAQAAGRPHQGIAAAIREVPTRPLAQLLSARPRLLVALDGICDPHNLGAIMRSAWALGAEGLVWTERRSAPLGAAAVRAAAGAHAHLPLCRVVNLGRALSACKAAGMWVVGTAADAPQPLAELDLPERLVLVVGGEERGLRPAVAGGCDMVGAIAQRPESGSLNASVACGIALYALRRRPAAPVPRQG